MATAGLKGQMNDFQMKETQDSLFQSTVLASNQKMSLDREMESSYQLAES